MLNIYLSYRPEDKPMLVKAIYERLVHEFGASSISKDVNKKRDISRPDAPNPRGEVEWAINRCDVMLVIIGNHWVMDRQGNRHMTNLQDPVLQELSFAFLRKDLPIIPVLIDNAKFPSEAKLEMVLRPLAMKNAAIVRDGEDFERDMMHLIDQINKLAAGQISGVRTLTEPEGNPNQFAANSIRRSQTIAIIGLSIGMAIGLLILAVLLLYSVPQ